MAAKELMFFLPKDYGCDQVLKNLVDELDLNVLDIPVDLKLNYQFLARRGEGKSLLEIEFRENSFKVIQELSEWEKPSQEYKDLLLKCESSINLYYRNPKDASAFIEVLVGLLGEITSKCLVENGEGCLLLLNEMSGCIKKDMNWSWERTTFPDLQNVSDSEWID